MGRRKDTKKRPKKDKEEEDDVVKDKIGRIRKKSQSHSGQKIGGWTEEEMNTALGHYWYEQNNPPKGLDKKGNPLKPISIRGISNKYFGGRYYETIRDKIARNVTGEHASGGKGRKRGQQAPIFTVEMMQQAFKKIKSSGQEDDEIEQEEQEEEQVEIQQEEAPLPPKKKFLSKRRQMLQLKKKHALKEVQILVKDLKDVVGMAQAREEFNRPENKETSQPNVQQAGEASHGAGTSTGQRGEGFVPQHLVDAFKDIDEDDIELPTMIPLPGDYFNRRTASSKSPITSPSRPTAKGKGKGKKSTKKPTKDDTQKQTDQGKKPQQPVSKQTADAARTLAQRIVHSFTDSIIQQEIPTAAVNCSQHVMDQLAQLNMKALQVQKGKVRTVALQAVSRRQRATRIQTLKKKVSQIVEIDITGDSPPKSKPSQDDTPADNETQQPLEKNTATPADKPAEETVSFEKPVQKAQQKPEQKAEKKPEQKAEKKPEQKPVTEDKCMKKELILKLERVQPKKEIVTKPVPDSKKSLKLEGVKKETAKAPTTKPKMSDKKKPVGLKTVEQAKAIAVSANDEVAVIEIAELEELLRQEQQDKEKAAQDDDTKDLEQIMNESADYLLDTLCYTDDYGNQVPLYNLAENKQTDALVKILMNMFGDQILEKHNL